MKRSPMPARKAPLRRSTPLRSSGPPKIQRRSQGAPDRTPAQHAAYLANTAERIRQAGGLCEIRFDRICRHWASKWCHHVFPQRLAKRMRIPIDDSIENLRACCWPCNVHVESIGADTAAALGLFSPVPLDPAAQTDRQTDRKVDPCS